MKTLKLSDVARSIGVTRQTLYNMLEDGRFPVLPVPNTNPRRWLEADVIAWLQGNNNAA